MSVEVIQPLFPEIPLPPGCATADEAVRELVAQGLQQRYGDRGADRKAGRQDIQQRCQHELQTIEREGVSPYFLILHDCLRWAREQGIPVGPGRGAAAGSLVCYALGITAIDPILHGLQFERMYNPEHLHAGGGLNCPDIDVDLGAAGRMQVLQYIQRTYGMEQAMRFISVDRTGRREVHSCGIAIAPQGALRGLPRWSDPVTGQEVLALERDELHAMGIITYDLLGMQQLDRLQKLETAAGSAADPNANPNQYAAALKLLSEGRTEDIWLCSGSMQQHLRQAQPQGFGELCSLTTMYRPGLWHYLPDFIANTQPHLSLLPQPLPARLQARLKDSRGILIYQEQVNQLLQDIGMPSPEQADQLRRQLAGNSLPDWPDAPHHPAPTTQLQEFLRQIVPATFCNAHAAAYTSISLRLAYIKAVRPDLWAQCQG